MKGANLDVLHLQDRLLIRSETGTPPDPVTSISCGVTDLNLQRNMKTVREGNILPVNLAVHSCYSSCPRGGDILYHR